MTFQILSINIVNELANGEASVFSPSALYGLVVKKEFSEQKTFNSLASELAININNLLFDPGNISIDEIDIATFQKYTYCSLNKAYIGNDLWMKGWKLNC